MLHPHGAATWPAARYLDAGEVFAALVGARQESDAGPGVAGLGATAMPEIGSEVLAQVPPKRDEPERAEKIAYLDLETC